jgi:signal transduction histidine kinase
MFLAEFAQLAVMTAAGATPPHSRDRERHGRWPGRAHPRGRCCQRLLLAAARSTAIVIEAGANMTPKLMRLRPLPGLPRARRHSFAVAGIAALAACFGAMLGWPAGPAAAGASPVRGLVAATVAAAGAAGLVWLARHTLRRRRLAAAYHRRELARLTRRNALLQNTLDNIGEGLSVFDARGRLVAHNSRFRQLLDLQLDLLVGTPLGAILLHQASRGDFGDVDPAVETACRLERFYREVPLVAERLTPAGRTLQIRRTAMPDGAVVTVYSDVTEIRAAERRLQEARSQAETANQSKSEFLANMSHELRTPLNAIIGFTEIISQELFGPIGNDKYLEYIKDVHSSSLHLLSIINDVLDMSKIEAGKLELAKQAVGLHTVIGDVIRIVHERASNRGIDLIFDAAEEPVVIWADERAMKQIFLNLLSNAIKFSEEREEIHIRLTTVTGEAIVEVEDRGIGMDEKEQERALQPFGQAKPAITSNYGGTGLGLPITKGLVEAHDGSLAISSRVGAGTTVRVVLPTRLTLPLDADHLAAAEAYGLG